MSASLRVFPGSPRYKTSRWISWCKPFLHCACLLVDNRSSQQESWPLPPSRSPGAPHWWHQLVWKWPLVPPHHCGTNIAAQGSHQRWRTAVVRGQERKPGQMMIHIHHIHHIPPPPQVLFFSIPRAQAVTPETNTLYIYSMLWISSSVSSYWL